GRRRPRARTAGRTPDGASRPRRRDGTERERAYAGPCSGPFVKGLVQLDDDRRGSWWQGRAIMNIRSSNGKLGMRGRRPADRKALEERGLQAARLFAKGLHPAEVARQLGVSRQSTSVWFRAWEAEGNQGLKGAERAGRPPLLTEKGA